MSNTHSIRALSWGGFVALAIAMGIGRFAFTPLLPMMQNDLGMGLAQGGWLAGANYLGYLAGALTAGYLPWKTVTLLRAGLLLVAGTTALMGWTTVWSTWIAWRSIAGFASAWVLVGAASLCLGQLAAVGASRNAGLVFSGVGGGIAIAGLLCLLLDLRGYSARQAWLILGLVAAVGIPATVALWSTSATFTSRPGDPAQRPASGKHLRLILCYGLFGFGYILPATFLPAQARTMLDDPALFGLAWPMFGLAAAFSTLLCSGLLQHFSRRKLWLAAQLILALGVALPAWLPSLAGVIIAAACVGGTFMVITMLGMQQAQASGGTRARSLMASLTAAFATGQLAGPVLFSLAYEHLDSSLEAALLTATAVLLAGCLLLLKPFAECAAGTMAGETDQSAR